MLEKSNQEWLYLFKKYNTNSVNDRVKKDAAEIWTLNLLHSNWFLTHWATFQTNFTFIWFIYSKWIFFPSLSKNRQFCLFLVNFNLLFEKKMVIKSLNKTTGTQVLIMAQ